MTLIGEAEHESHYLECCLEGPSRCFLFPDNVGKSTGDDDERFSNAFKSFAVLRGLDLQYSSRHVAFP